MLQGWKRDVIVCALGIFLAGMLDLGFRAVLVSPYQRISKMETDIQSVLVDLAAFHADHAAFKEQFRQAHDDEMRLLNVLIGKKKEGDPPKDPPRARNTGKEGTGGKAEGR